MQSVRALPTVETQARGRGAICIGIDGPLSAGTYAR